MSMRRIVALHVGVLLVAVLANASAGDGAIRIKVLDSETRSVSLGGNDVPKNCDQVNFDAYCNSSKTATLTNTLLVQEGNEPPFHIACTIDSKFSRCTPLPKGESFDARREKNGITVYYVDDKGKARKQLYTLVDVGGKAGPAAASAAIATQPVPVPAATSPRQSSPVPAPVPAPAPSVGSVQAAPPEKVEKVKCNFSSTPAGADITLDGKYVGSTPSEISLNIGSHVVVFSMPGFMQWKRELTVLSGSELTVNAILQKGE
jgi:PEGA domain